MATLAPGEQARMYALGGVARGGATRGGYVDGRVYVWYGGQQIGYGKSGPLGILIGSLSISQELDETPDTCRFRTWGGIPARGAELAITLGSKNSLTPIFAGFALTVQQVYVGDRPANVECDVAAVDYTWLLGFTKVTGQYRDAPADSIIVDLIARYGAVNGFTTIHVQALPLIDVITFTNEDLPEAITRVVRMVGAYWYCDYRRDIHAFLEETGTGAPVAITPDHPSLDDVVHAGERTQALSRVYVEGRGTKVVAPIPANSTEIPLERVDMFAVDPDVFAKAAFQGTDGGALHVSYTGVFAPGGGALVGPGVGPASPLTVVGAVGAGSVTPGAHSYAVTFVTAAGESLPSPVATLPGTTVSDPTIGPPVAQINVLYNGNSFTIGDQMAACYVWSGTAVGASYEFQTAPTAPSPTYTVVSNNDPTNPSHAAVVSVGVRHSPNPRVKWVHIYLWSQLQGGWFLAWGIDNNPAAPPDHTFAVQIGGDTYSAVGPLPTNNSAIVRVDVSAIPVSASVTPVVTARKLYRSAANTTAPLKLLATIADNTTATFTDTLADASLGANAPASDTSGLQQPEGIVLPGAAVLPVSSSTGFSLSGGWAIVGNGQQQVRYSGVTATSLTGIPAWGSLGALTAPVSYGASVTAAPMLTGIPAGGAKSLTLPLAIGDELYLVAQVDDLATRSELVSMGAGTGIREEWITDRRLSIAEAKARAKATLAQRRLETVTVNYRVRDRRTAVGKVVTIDLPPPTALEGTYRIQRVQIDRFRPRAPYHPTYAVTASSSVFSFDDWLRRMRTEV